MSMRWLSTGLVAIALWGCGAGIVWAQEPVLGTPGAMANPDAAKIALRVSADGEYTWKLDGLAQGMINAAMGAKEILTVPGRHEITARGVDGKTRFDLIVTVAPEKQNSVKIVGRPVHGATTAATPSSTSTPRTSARTQPASSEMPPPERTNYPNPYAGNPDMFVRVMPQSSPHYTVSYAGGRKSGKVDGYQITVIATSPTTYYDIKVQMVMKGMGSAGSTVELPDLLPGGMIPNTYTAVTPELGKEAVICYTARPPSQTAQRWTGTFNIQNGASPGMMAFVPAREPTLEKASDAPCGGLHGIKEAAAPVETAAAPESGKPEVASPQASLALARGSQYYNAHHYAEARPLLITACEGGTSADACNAVGYMYQNNLGTATDYVKAREYYLKSCNDDSSFSCANLGTLYRDGLGVPRNYTEALSLFERGCDAGVPEGCHAAGKMYLDHVGVAQNNAKALELFKKACDQDIAGACGDEAYVYAMGLGVPKDLAFAASLFKRACGMGSRNSCFSMGEMYRSGDGVPRDPVKSKEYYGKACEMGDQDSCSLAR